MIPKRSILENYIKHTFNKLSVDYTKDRDINKDNVVFSENDKYLLFNSGLLNGYVEEIIIVGEKSIDPMNALICKNPFVANNRTELVRDYGFNKHQIERWPGIVTYFENIEQVVFQADIDRIDFDYDKLYHIIDERAVERWPTKYRELLQAGETRMLAEDLKIAISNAIRIAERNYKYVVPHYSIGRDAIQFLMPIYLNRDYRAMPDFALVLHPDQETGYYLPETVLTLDAAYNNARLIAKPDDMWLNPSTITQFDERTAS